MVSTRRFESPLGDMILTARDGKLVEARFVREDETFTPVSRTIDPINLEAFVAAQDWLCQFFCGKSPNVTVPIEIDGTPFAKEVYERVSEIGFGETVSYMQIAKDLADKRGIESMGAQAIGQALSRNPLLLFIPCHRVIGSNGKLTGYAAGLKRKQALLDLERQQDCLWDS